MTSTEQVDEARLRELRAWASRFIGSLSGANTTIDVINELLAARQKIEELRDLFVTALEWLRETEPCTSEQVDAWSERMQLSLAPPSQPKCETCGGEGSVKNSREEANVVGEEWSDCPDCAPSQPEEQGGQFQISESNKEVLDTINDIEAFFRKEYAYEVENIGAGGSQIAAGRWKRYYMALYNLAHDLPELISNSRSFDALTRQMEEMRKALESVRRETFGSPWEAAQKAYAIASAALTAAEQVKQEPKL